MNKTLTNTKDINLTFKLLSAIGIVIIVSGHCYKGGISLGYEWFPIYSFNLSLFAFISGYFYKSENEDNALRYIGKRAKRLLLPAYIWNIVYGAFIVLMSGFGYTIGGEVNPFNLFLMPFVDGEAFVYNLGSWFVYPLFLVYAFNVLFRKLLRLIKFDNEYLILIIYFAIGIIGVQLCIDNSSTGIKGIFLLLMRAVFFLPCFGLGHFYRARLENKDKLNSIAYFAIIFAIQLILLTFCENLEYTPSKCSKFLNGCVVPYITSITGIAFWLRVSKLLTPIVKNWRIVRLIADNTYSIMIHHLFGFMVVKWIFYALSIITPLFADFNAYSMKNNAWYFYLPNGLKQYSILYLLGGIFVSVLIGVIQKWLCSVFKSCLKKG